MLQKVTDDDVRNALDRQFLHHDDVGNVAQSALSTDDVEFHDDVEIHHDDVGNAIPATFSTDAVEKHPCCRKCKFLHSAHSDDVENDMDDVEKGILLMMQKMVTCDFLHHLMSFSTSQMM